MDTIKLLIEITAKLRLIILACDGLDARIAHAIRELSRQ